jgi:hypothetical protein
VYINGIVTTNSIAKDSFGMLEAVVDSLGDPVLDGLGNPVTIFSTTTLEPVTDINGDIVLDLLGSEVTTLVLTGSNTTFGFKYPTSKRIGTNQYEFTFSEEYSTMNRDWQTLGDGVSYSSFYTGGYQLKSDAQRFGQTNYIVVYSNVLTDASAFINVIWDYGKVTGAVNQIYRNNLSLGITQTRIMLRGRGRVFQYKVTSDGDKPFEVIGWSVFETQNSSI